MIDLSPALDWLQANPTTAALVFFALWALLAFVLVARNRKATRPGYVYVVQSPTGYYKIGRTKNPEDRMKTFSVKLPFEVKYVCVIPAQDMVHMERHLHQHYKDKRANGEWFALTPRDIDDLRKLAKKASA